LLISDLEEANNDNMKYKDYEENCSSANRIKKESRRYKQDNSVSYFWIFLSLFLLFVIKNLLR